MATTRREKYAARDKALCDYHLAGHTLAECGRRFKLTRVRVQQIVKKAGVWTPYEKTDRSEFLGVSVSRKTKDALRTEAERKGISVSKLASDALEDTIVKRSK